MEHISITEKNGPNYGLLEVSGTINSYTCAEFQVKVYALIKQTNLVLDLSRVTNLSSSGLGVIMAAWDDGEQNGTKLYIMKPSEIVRLALESTGFSDMFSIIYSLTEVV
jgi:anti-sigma B factor antagonist